MLVIIKENKTSENEELIYQISEWIIASDLINARLIAQSSDDNELKTILDDMEFAPLGKCKIGNGYIMLVS